MTEKKRNAPARPRTRPSSGVTHENEPLRDNFTVISNELLQHPELSTLAKGLGSYIQSLPEGTPVGIKALAERLPEGEIRIAAALRELEKHGFLSRTKERLPSGQVTTRTTSYNKPRRALAAAAPPTPPEAVAKAKADRPSRGAKASDLLAGLRAHDSRLLLTERDVHRLAPAVAEWLERGVPPTAVVRTLTTGLPQDPIKHPAAFLSHRLTAQLPPHLPAPPPSLTAPRPDPLQTCDGCDRAFRATRPGRCRDCRGAAAAA
ncbi:DNA-binding protein [Streptomyces sp. MUSC 14]|uniref:DNA-binding protein n=1 Tax=Streptomyces sp. MUSC 14 TaxID=1354889 RepID=UPI0008F5B199|nr:DNA-binding protein [Streptomyces sp. MUSC 14]OIJ87722.1 DNA-binding protein [Streptomyces sp. MUSC 14]